MQSHVEVNWVLGFQDVNLWGTRSIYDIHKWLEIWPFITVVMFGKHTLSSHYAFCFAGREGQRPPDALLSYLPGVVGPGTQPSCQRPHFPLPSRRACRPYRKWGEGWSRNCWAFATALLDPPGISRSGGLKMTWLAWIPESPCGVGTPADWLE